MERISLKSLPQLASGSNAHTRHSAAHLDLHGAFTRAWAPLPQACTCNEKAVRVRTLEWQCIARRRHACAVTHLPSAEAVHTALPSGVNEPHVTGPLWPAKTCKSSQSAPRSLVPTHPRPQHLHARTIRNVPQPGTKVFRASQEYHAPWVPLQPVHASAGTF